MPLQPFEVPVQQPGKNHASTPHKKTGRLTRPAIPPSLRLKRIPLSLPVRHGRFHLEKPTPFVTTLAGDESRAKRGYASRMKSAYIRSLLVILSALFGPLLTAQSNIIPIQADSATTVVNKWGS